MTAAEYRYTIDELNARLSPRARDLCGRLFGQVQERNGQIWMRNPDRTDPNFTSFSYCPASGIWKDFFLDVGGKGLWSLVRDFACAGDARRTFEWCKDYLGLTGKSPDPAQAKHFAIEQKKRDEKAVRDAAEQARAAKGLWLNALPLHGSDAASVYLRARGIDVRTLAGGMPQALRHHHAVMAFAEDPKHRGPWPAMVAAIARHGDGIIAAHRTYLKPVDGGWAKRAWPKCDGKQVKGAYAGGYIALTRGASGKPLRDAPDGEWVQIGEGIEDALTGAILKPEIRAISAISVSNIGGLVLPPQIKGAYLLQQNDDEPAAIAAFERAMDKLFEKGIEPAIVKFDPRFKDANDVLRGIEKEVA